jgi:hypothetical protein
MKFNSILLLSTLTLAANAADCTAKNQQWFSSSAVQMMWSIRAWLCPNAWNQAITAGPDGGWCEAGGGVVSAYWGTWTIAGMQSEQQCWVRIPLTFSLLKLYALVSAVANPYD